MCSGSAQDDDVASGHVETAVATEPNPATTSTAPIGIFDSGVGGLSVLRHIRDCLKNEQLIYVADASHAPYGERTEAQIEERALRIGAFLVAHGVKAIVVACNTATAVAIKALRSAYPTLAVIGVEPGLKPAIAVSRSKIIGVLATEATLASEKFVTLRESLARDGAVRFLQQPCTGLADRIEQGLFSDAQTRSMLHGYIAPLLQQGADTLVLGCTHYPFVAAQIAEIAAEFVGTQPVAASQINIIDTGEAIARRLTDLLMQRGLCAPRGQIGTVHAFSSGSVDSLHSAFVTLLDLRVDVRAQVF